MYYYNEKPLPLDKAFTDIDGNQYPANWLRNSTQAQRDALGITWVAPDPDAQFDQRFYWGVGNPKDHATLVKLWVGKVKETAGTMLSVTDWYVTRNAETLTSIPQEVLDRRAEIREYSNIKETAIVSTNTTEELATYVTSPNYSLWAPPETVAINSDTITTAAGNEDVLIFSGGTTSATVMDSVSFS